MVIQKKVSFIIALLILHLAAFAQAENERYPMQASGIVRSHKVSQSDFIPPDMLCHLSMTKQNLI